SIEDAEKITSKTAEEIYSRLGEHVRSITMSRSFTEIRQVKCHYLQCLTLQTVALHLNKTKQLFRYEEYVFYTLLAEISDEAKLKEKVHPALPVLRQHDLQNRGNLYETLDIYVKTQGNLKETAAKLYVHRNSLSYRINKIVELTSVDLADTATNFRLYMSFCIEKYLY
ncbi:MAG: helix-turn-helix domain-containing protein, partial [Mobilitalea sp.]